MEEPYPPGCKNNNHEPQKEKLQIYTHYVNVQGLYAQDTTKFGGLFDHTWRFIDLILGMLVSLGACQSKPGIGPGDTE